MPYREGTWIDPEKIKVGYEFPFNRQVYENKPARPLADIERDIEILEKEILALLKEITA